MTQGSVRDTTGYVNYVYNISARGTTQVASQLMGLSNVTGSILGQLAFQTSSYLSSTEGALLSMGIVATAGFSKATQKASEFDQALSTIGAISGKTRDEVSNLGDQAIAMSNKFGMAVGEMTKGLESLARAGVSTGNMNAILEEAMGLSKLEGLSLENAINNLISTTNLLDTQGLDLESPEYAEAVRRQNQRITATSEAAPINAQDIIHTLEHVGGYASSTNLDQDDLFAVIAQLGSKGTKSEMAGTSLRAFLAAGQKDTAQRALERIGLKVSDLWKNDDTIMSITDMKDVLDQAMEAKGYTRQEKLEFYSDFAGYKQANQIMKIDTDSAREFKEKIDRSWDMSAKINQVIGTAETHVQGLIQAGTNLLIKVGEPFLPIVSTIAATLKTGIDIINMIPGSNIVIAGGLILASIKSISTIFNKIVPQLVASKGHIGGISGLFKSIRDDLYESFILIKNMNNSDFMKQRSREIEANRINEQDKYAYWESKTNRRVNNMSDVWRLEREHGFQDDSKYIEWKVKEAKKPLKKEREPRNKRQKASNPPKTPKESSNNRQDNKNKISLNELSQTIITTSDAEVAMMGTIFNKIDDIYQSIQSINFIKTDIDFDESIINKLRNSVFKVEVINDASRIVPVHEMGESSWNRQQKYDREKKTTNIEDIIYKDKISNFTKDFIETGKVVGQERKVKIIYQFDKDEGKKVPVETIKNSESDIYDPEKNMIGYRKDYYGSKDSFFGLEDANKSGYYNSLIPYEAFTKRILSFKSGGHSKFTNEYQNLLFITKLFEKNNQELPKGIYKRLLEAKKHAEGSDSFQKINMREIDAAVEVVSPYFDQLQKKLGTIPDFESSKQPIITQGETHGLKYQITNLEPVQSNTDLGFNINFGQEIEKEINKLNKSGAELPTGVKGVRYILGEFIKGEQSKDANAKKIIENIGQENMNNALAQYEKFRSMDSLSIPKDQFMKIIFERTGSESIDEMLSYIEQLVFEEEENLNLQGYKTDFKKTQTELKKEIESRLQAIGNIIEQSSPNLTQTNPRETTDDVIYDLNQGETRLLKEMGYYKNKSPEFYQQRMEHIKEYAKSEEEAQEIFNKLKEKDINEARITNEGLEYLSKIYTSPLMSDLELMKTNANMNSNEFTRELIYAMRESDINFNTQGLQITKGGEISAANTNTLTNIVHSLIETAQEDEEKVNEFLHHFAKLLYDKKQISYANTKVVNDAISEIVELNAGEDIEYYDTFYDEEGQYIGTSSYDGANNIYYRESGSELGTIDIEELDRRLEEKLRAADPVAYNQNKQFAKSSNVEYGYNFSLGDGILTGGKESPGLEDNPKATYEHHKTEVRQKLASHIYGIVRARQELQDLIEFETAKKTGFLKAQHPDQIRNLFGPAHVVAASRQINRMNAGKNLEISGKDSLVGTANYAKITTMQKTGDNVIGGRVLGTANPFSSDPYIDQLENASLHRAYTTSLGIGVKAGIPENKPKMGITGNLDMENIPYLFIRRSSNKKRGQVPTTGIFEGINDAQDLSTHHILRDESGRYSYADSPELRLKRTVAMDTANTIKAQGILATYDPNYDLEKAGKHPENSILTSANIANIARTELTPQMQNVVKDMFNTQKFTDLKDLENQVGDNFDEVAEGIMTRMLAFGTTGADNINQFKTWATEEEIEALKKRNLYYQPKDEKTPTRVNTVTNEAGEEVEQKEYLIFDWAALQRTEDEVAQSFATSMIARSMLAMEESIRLQAMSPETFNSINKSIANLSEDILSDPLSLLKIRSGDAINLGGTNKLVLNDLTKALQTLDNLDPESIDLELNLDDIDQDVLNGLHGLGYSFDFDDKGKITAVKNIADEIVPTFELLYATLDNIVQQATMIQDMSNIFDSDNVIADEIKKRTVNDIVTDKVASDSDNLLYNEQEQKIIDDRIKREKQAIEANIIDNEKNIYTVRASLKRDKNSLAGNLTIGDVVKDQIDINSLTHSQKERTKEDLPKEWIEEPNEVVEKNVLNNSDILSTAIDTDWSFMGESYSFLKPSTQPIFMGNVISGQDSSDLDVFEDINDNYQFIDDGLAEPLSPKGGGGFFDVEEANKKRQEDNEKYENQKNFIHDNEVSGPKIENILIEDTDNKTSNSQTQNDENEQNTNTTAVETNNLSMPGGYYGQQSLPTYDDILKEQYADQYKERINNIKDSIFAKFTSGVNKVYDTVGGHDNTNIAQPLSNASKTLDDATLKLQGFTQFLQNASDHFAPLITAVIALEGVIYSLQSISKVTSGIEEILNLQNTVNTVFKGETFDLFGSTIKKNSNSAKVLLSISSVLGTVIDTITSFISAFLGPLLLLAGAFITTKMALDWSYQSHQKYLKSLEEEQKEKRSKAKALQPINENAQEAARRNRAPRQQDRLDRNAQLAQTRVDNANMTRSHGAIEITRQKNDTLWGDYGISAGLSKLSGNYQSTAEEYDGTSGQIRRIKEATLANPFASGSMQQVASYYDANQLVFGIMDEYKDELGKLYDAETGVMLKYHSDDVRGSPEFQKALDDFVEATGITRDHAQQYLDYMQTEHNVDKAQQTMQAQADQIAASTELKVQAITFGGNPADVLGLNGIEAQQSAMIKAQADMTKMELTGQLWWKAVWSTITTPVKLILSPLFIIVDLLSAIWSFVTGNFGDAFDKAGRAGSRLNVFGEAATYWGAWADAESTDFNAIGQNATDSYNRANYGNVQQPASGGYHPTYYMGSNQGYSDQGSGTHYMGVNRGSYHFLNKSQPQSYPSQPTTQLNPLSSIGTMLSTIISILTTGLLVGGGIYGLTKFLKSDLSLGEIGRGIFTTIRGSGSNLLDSIFEEGTIAGKIKNIVSDPIKSIFENIKGSFGTRKDQISGFLSRNFNIGRIKEEAEWYRHGGLDNASPLAKIYGKGLNYMEENPDSAFTKWISYPGEKAQQLKDMVLKGLVGNYTPVQKQREKVINELPTNLDTDEITDEQVDALAKKYNIDTSKVSTSFEKRTLVGGELKRTGKWDEAIGGLHDDIMLDHARENGLVNTAKTVIGEDYVNPWKEYLGGKAEEKKSQVKDYLEQIKQEVDTYRKDPETGDGASASAKILGTLLNTKDNIFGKAENTDFNELLKNPKEFLSDPRNIENMGKDIYSNYKDKYQKAKDDPSAQDEYGWYKDAGELRFMDLSRQNKIRAIGDKLSNVKHNVFGMEQGESVREMLKNPERTMEVLKTGIGNIQENGFIESLGLDEDFGISDEIKEKVSGLFDQVKEGITDGIDEDDENASFIDKAKKKIAGFFGWTKETDESDGYNKDVLDEEMSWYKAGELDFDDLSYQNKMKGVNPHFQRDVFGRQKNKHQGGGSSQTGKKCPRCGFENEPDSVYCVECGQKLDSPVPSPTGISESQGIKETVKNKLTGLFSRGSKEESQVLEEESQATAPSKESNGIFDTFKQIHNIDKDEIKDEMSQNKSAAKDVLTGKAFDLEPKYPKYYNPNLIYKEEMPGAFGEEPSILGLDDNESLLSKENLTKGGKGLSKLGGKLAGKGGKMGKLGKVMQKGGGMMGKAGKKGIGGVAKSGIGKLGKSGIGKAGGKVLGKVGGKVLGKVGGKLAGKAAAQVASKVLAGGLAATGIGAPLAAIMASPIGGFLMEGVMDLGGKALGAIGGAIGGIGKGIGNFLGFGKKTHYGGSSHGGGSGGLGLMGAMMPALGPIGLLAGGIGGLFGGGSKNMGKSVGGLAKSVAAAPFVAMTHLLSGIKKDNKMSSRKSHELTEKTNKAISKQAKTNNSSGGSGGNITIQNININTSDDPEAIKAMFLELIIELQEQINPRLVSRTIGEAPEIQTAPTDNTTNADPTDQNDQNTTNPNGDNNNTNNTSS